MPFQQTELDILARMAQAGILAHMSIARSPRLGQPVVHLLE
jgi:hypothetical protein